jgi:Phosphopantetheine attachment site
MGLELVDFILTLEKEFGIDIPDRDAATFHTPRQAVDYLVARVDGRWSRAEIERIVVDTVIKEFGVMNVPLDADFVRDLGAR